MFGELVCMDIYGYTGRPAGELRKDENFGDRGARSKTIRALGFLLRAFGGNAPTRKWAGTEKLTEKTYVGKKWKLICQKRKKDPPS